MAVGMKTGGRQKGTPNKKTLDKMAQQLSAAGEGKVFKGNALEFLQAIYRDETRPDSVRISAAYKALEYEVEKKPQKVENVFVLSDAALSAIVATGKPALAAPKIIDAEVTD